MTPIEAVCVFIAVWGAFSAAERCWKSDKLAGVLLAVCVFFALYLPLMWLFVSTSVIIAERTVQ